MSNYIGGKFFQSIYGGNVQMDIALHVHNAYNIVLQNTASTTEGSLAFGVNDYSPLPRVVTGEAITGNKVKEN